MLMATMICCVAGCAQSTTRMQVGEPIKVNRGVCLANTSYEQGGKRLNWNDTTHKLSQFKVSEPHISAGNAWAIGSIVAAALSTPAIIVGADGRQGTIDMDQDLASGLLVGGIIVGVAGLVMCVVSDGQYAKAGDAYNEHLGKTEGGDDRAHEEPESSR